MTFPTHNDDDGMVESYRITDADGDLYAVITYFRPGHTPGWNFDCWVVDYADGQRLTGDVANEAARRLMNSPGTDGRQTSRFDQQADSILDSVTYDDDSRTWRITWGGASTWFQAAEDRGADVILYEDRDQTTRAGVLEAPPFDAQDLDGQMNISRRRLD